MKNNRTFASGTSGSALPAWCSGFAVILAIALLSPVGCSREKKVETASAPPPPAPSVATDNSTPPETGKVLFRINGNPVGEAELAIFADTFQGGNESKGKSTPAEMVDTLINNRLLSERAVKEKIDTLPGVRGQLEIRKNKMWIDPYWSKVVRPTVRITDKEIMAKAPKMEEMVAIQQFVADTREQAEEIRKRAMAGEDFGKLIKAHSRGLSAENEGKIGYIKRDNPTHDPQTIEEIFRLKPGEYTRVTETKIGFWFARELDRKSPEQLKKEWFSANRDKVRSDLERDAWMKHRGELTKRYKVTVHQKAIDQYFAARKTKKNLDAALAKDAVTIDGAAFSVRDLVDPSGTGIIHGEQTLEMIANDRVEEYVISRELEKLGLKKDFPKLVIKERLLTEDLLARKYIDARTRGVKVTENELRALYEERKDRFRSLRMLDVSLIETRSEKRLETIYAQLGSGVPFGKVAAEWNDNKKVPEGRLGFVEEDKIAPEFAAVKTLKPGEYLKDPIRLSRDGKVLLYVVARLNDLREARPLSYEEVKRGQLEKVVVARKREAIVKKIMEDLRKENKVEFTDQFKALAEKSANPKTPHGRI
jgi:hypothetical protein